MSARSGIGRRVALVASAAPSLTVFRGPLIRDLISEGHAVLCLAPDLDERLRVAVLGLGAEARTYPLERTGLDPRADLRSLRALRAHFGDWKPDVVMGYTAKPAIYGALAARSARVPRIVPMLTGLGYAFLDGGGVKRLAVRKATLALYKRAFRASHAAIFHNRDDLAVIRAHRVLPERLPVHVVSGSGIDLAHYTPVAFPPTGDGLTFLMIARLVRYKGVEEYCEAARAVKTAHPRTRFVLVGPEEGGPAGFSASALAAWSDCVEYLGPSDDVREHIARSHVYVLPSYGEGMPRTVLEAMALGRPIITTDARGCRETVDERVNGCLVPTGDSRALAEAMLSFLRRPDEIPAMGRASRQKAERRFDVRMVNREMIDILVGSASVVTGGIERLSA